MWNYLSRGGEAVTVENGRRVVPGMADPKTGHKLRYREILVRLRIDRPAASFYRVSRADTADRPALRPQLIGYLEPKPLHSGYAVGAFGRLLVRPGSIDPIAPPGTGNDEQVEEQDRLGFHNDRSLSYCAEPFD